MATYKKLLKNRAGDTIIPVSEYDVYSTSEQVAGVWIDGKPLYKKVIKVNNPTTNSTVDQPHGIANLKMGFIKQMFVVNGYASREVNYFYNTSEYCVSQINQTNISFRIPTSTWSWGGVDYLIAIVEYTKTTD